MSIEVDAGGVALEVTDQGVGFDSDVVVMGHGLRNMAERAHEVGALLTVRSEVGQGTRVAVSWERDQADRSIIDLAEAGQPGLASR